VKLIPYTPDQATRWDAFVPASAQGTFLHTRRFLSYHRDRFVDRSLLIEDDNGRLRAVLPAALSLADTTVVVSHPGITFGGLLHDPNCRPHEVTETLTAILQFYRSNSIRSLLYRSVPTHAQFQPVALDQHALWLLGGTLVRRDLWNVIELRVKREVSRTVRRGMLRAQESGIRVELASADDYVAFHAALSRSLEDRHGVAPVHTLAELLEMRMLFPTEVELWIARNPANQLIAGNLMFRYNERTWHAQYTATNEESRDMSVGKLLIQTIIAAKEAEGATCFSFGASTEALGRTLNSGLFEYKARFGDGSAVQDFIELKLL
jgi:Acetyltransferase (GNAT) domain